MLFLPAWAHFILFPLSLIDLLSQVLNEAEIYVAVWVLLPPA